MDHFVLSAELRLHEQDVKAVCALSGGGIGSGSRDRATVVWSPAEDGARPPYRPTHTHSLHEHFVNSVCEYGARQLASGSGSGNVGGLRLWDVASGAEAAPAEGHTRNVCALAVAPNGDLLSGSWDNTARVWRDGATVAVLAGHESAVWAVLGLESGVLVTGSGDKTIKLWQDGVCVKTLAGHTDSVRSLQRVPGIGFISAANDGTAKLWSEQGDELATYVCHEQYIYAVAVLSSSEFATCSEDKSVKIFRDGQPSQTIQHPGVVWSAAALPNGDLVTGCQDGAVRVWTRCAERAAPAEEVVMYEEQLAAQTMSSQETGNVDPSKLPGPEALQAPGDSDGQVKLVKSASGGAEAHSWSAAEGRWVMVGTVVDGPGGGGGGASGGAIGGVEYDFVFDVDLEDGSPMRKLGVNRGEDPMVAAYRFLETEGVPTSTANVDQITQFIEQQVGGFTIGAEGGAAGSVDPLTGAGAYVPSGGGAPTAGGAVADDNPWMSGYRPPAVSDESAAAGAQANPWLPDDRYVPGGGADSAPSMPPVTWPLVAKATYAKGNMVGIGKKLNQFAEELRGAEGNPIVPEVLGPMLESLASDATSTDVSQELLATLGQLLTWPDDKVFPAVDLCKLLILRPGMQSHSEEIREQLLSSVLALGERMAAKLPNGEYATVEKVRYANTRLALEFTTNLIAAGGAPGATVSAMPRFLALAQESCLKENKTEKRAALAVMLNCSISYFQGGGAFPGEKALCLSALSEYMSREVQRSLASGRFDCDVVGLESALACLGNVLHGDSTARQLATAAGMKDNLEKFIPMLPAANAHSARAVAALLA